MLLKSSFIYKQLFFALLLKNVFPLSLVQLLHMMAQYVNTLEGDKRTLRAQVKRLASENNWLRKELADHQHLLQETEIQLARVREEKEQLEFTISNQKVGEELKRRRVSVDENAQSVVV